MTRFSKEFKHQVYFKWKKKEYYTKIKYPLCLAKGRKKRTKAESSDWRRAYMCPSDRTAGQMRNGLDYRETP